MTQADVGGALLVASFALWFPAAALPARIWTAPLPERLSLIGERRRAWQAVNVSIAGAAVLLVLGFAALSEPLHDAGAGTLVPLSLAALVLGAIPWLASVTFRVSTAPAADAEPASGYEVASRWAGGLFLLWSALGNAAVVGFGAAVVHCGYPGVWAGWAAIALAALMLAQLLVTGDALPALYHVGPALIGVAVLVD